MAGGASSGSPAVAVGSRDARSAIGAVLAYHHMTATKEAQDELQRMLDAHMACLASDLGTKRLTLEKLLRRAREVFDRRELERRTRRLEDAARDGRGDLVGIDLHAVATHLAGALQMREQLAVAARELQAK